MLLTYYHGLNIVYVVSEFPREVSMTLGNSRWDYFRYWQHCVISL